MNTYWLSFVRIEGGEQALGCAVVEAPSEIEAVQLTHALRINPGGEVLIVECPMWQPDVRAELAQYPRNVLLSPERVRAGGAQQLKDLEDA